MPLIIKGEINLEKVEQKTPAQLVTHRWDNKLNRIVPVEENKPEPVVVKPEPVKPIIKRQVVEKEIVETPSHYHEEVHGELHKLFNKKSDYLRDILDFDSNK